ncbi:MAG: zinc ribbon domain-containing protein [Kocuria sp.]|nr:zinc ribbon domain-containing protein [Kocuria sp.]
MPVYAYKCKDCDHQFDQRQSFSDAPLTVCPECGGDLRKQFNSVGVVFKGSGFYRNDARQSSTSAGSADTGSAQKDSGASTDTKTSTDSGTSSTTTAASSSGSSSEN